MPFAMLLAAIGFILGCTDKDTNNAINVSEVKKCHIQIEPHQNKNTLIDIIQNCNLHGKPYISVASKINGKDYYENFDMLSNMGSPLGGCLKKSGFSGNGKL